MGRQPNISFANLFDTVMLTVWHKSAKKIKMLSMTTCF